MVDDSRVFEAADLLYARGVKPTNGRVRDAIGGGSFRDIGPHLRKWWCTPKRQRASGTLDSEQQRQAPPQQASTLRAYDAAVGAGTPAEMVPRNVVDAELAAMRDEVEGLRRHLLIETDNLRRNADSAHKDRIIKAQDDEIFLLKAKLEVLERERR